MASTYLSPGVYIEEVPAGAKPVQGVPTGVLAILGKTERGPLLEPVRVTGWGEFQARFGGKLADSFTADAVWGYFENGGGAAYVVRCDDSSAASWELFDGAGNTVLTVEAESPGRWANALELVAGPQRGGASGRRYFARLTAPGDLTLADGNNATITVDSAVGVQPGERMRLRHVDTTEVVVEVTGVSGDRVDITQVSGGAVTLARRDTVLLAEIPAAGRRVDLLVGSGFREGDVLEVTVPGETTRDALIQSAESTAQGMRLELDAGLGAIVRAAGFAQRRARFDVDFRVATDGTVVAAGQVVPTQEGVPAAYAVGDRLLAWGMEAAWDAGAGAFEFPSAARDGRGQVDVGLQVRSLRRPISVTAANTAPGRAALAERLGFLPSGTEVTVRGDDGNDYTVRRVGSGVNFVGGAAAAPADTVTLVEAVVEIPDALTNGVVLACPRAPEVGDYVDFAGDPIRVTAVEPLQATGLYAVEFAEDLAAAAGEGAWNLLAWQATRFESLRFGLTVRDGEWRALETYDDLSLDDRHRSFVARDGVINQASSRIRVRPLAAGVVPGADRIPVGARSVSTGTLGDPTLERFRDGFATLERVTEPDLVACPDALAFSDEATLQAAVIDAMIGHAEQHMRFAVVDAPDIRDEQALAEWRLTTVSSTHAAVYAPHLKMVNLDSGATDRYLFVPPSGFCAGVCSRTDGERGVFKPPANERVRGVVGLARDFTERQQDLLNPRGVNLVRAFRGRGIRVWGARNATDDTQWRYVNVRRLFNFLERSTREGTEWVVFEPNDARTWLRVRVSLENFLNGVWRAGGLLGAVPEQAYQVKIGLGETMTYTDIDLGLLIVEVAVAPVKPAEFVVFRFSHKVQTET